MPFVDVTVGRPIRPLDQGSAPAPKTPGDVEQVRTARAPHLLSGAWAIFKKALSQGAVDTRRGLARAYRRHLVTLGMMDSDELTLLPSETHDDVFTAVLDTMDRFPEESSFFVFQRMLRKEGETTPWGETTPAPLSNPEQTGAWLKRQEEAIVTTLNQTQESEHRLWLVSREREFREIRERLEDILIEQAKD